MPGSFKNGCSKLDIQIESSRNQELNSTHSRMYSVYEDAEQLDEEIDLVARMMADAAERQLPLVQPKRLRR